MTQQILFSHCDLDGIGAGVIFKKMFGEDSEVHYLGYNSINERIKDRLKKLRAAGETPTIFMVDISVNEEVARLLDVYPGEKHLLDHHESAKWLDVYDWATVDTSSCGTKLLFEYVPFMRKGVLAEYAEFVHHVNDYDLWIHENSRSKELNRLFYILGIDRFEARMLRDPDPYFTNPEVLLLELEDEAFEKYTNKVERGMAQFELNGEPFCGIAYADRFQSEVAHELMERNDLEMVALVDVNARKVSLRSKGEVDVSRIAKSFGGGGHPNASGFEFGDDGHAIAIRLNAAITNVYEEIVMFEMTELFSEVK